MPKTKIVMKFALVSNLFEPYLLESGYVEGYLILLGLLFNTFFLGAKHK
jgi:hypothetical protein